MDMQQVEAALQTLRELCEEQELSIITLSEPISSAAAEEPRQQRASDVSTTSFDAPTPTSLEADLSHYRELFAKLRFSYVEQVTKEKFIRAIVGDPPLIVTMQENLDLEQQNMGAKTQLKAFKAEVEEMVAQLEQTGRELSRRYEGVKTETVRLRELPTKLQQLEERIAELHAAAGQDGGSGASDDPRMRLPITRTLELVEEKKAEQMELDRELRQLQAQLPRKKKELALLQAELQPLEIKRQTSTAAAKEARRRKDAALGGVEDDLEFRARWWRASEGVLQHSLNLKG